MPAVAESPTARTRVPPLAVVAMLVVLPLAAPMAWLAGVLALLVDRPRGWRLTVAICPGGLYLPMWLYGHAEEVGQAGYPLAALALLGCIVATHRLVSR